MKESLLPLAILISFTFSVPAEDITPQEAKNQVGKVATATGKEGPTNLTSQTFPKDSCWPDKVHLTKASTVSATIGSGGIKSTLPVGSEVWAYLAEDNKTITIQTNDLKGSIPIDDTDFIKLANERKESEGGRIKKDSG